MRRVGQPAKEPKRTCSGDRFPARGDGIPSSLPFQELAVQHLEREPVAQIK